MIRIPRHALDGFRRRIGSRILDLHCIERQLGTIATELRQEYEAFRALIEDALPVAEPIDIDPEAA